MKTLFLKKYIYCFLHAEVRLLTVGDIQVVPDVKEVLDTFRVAAELGTDSLGAYVISMASNVSLMNLHLFPTFSN